MNFVMRLDAALKALRCGNPEVATRHLEVARQLPAPSASQMARVLVLQRGFR
jgi:hypothetical protein